MTNIRKFTDQQILEIRKKLYKAPRGIVKQLALEYGVSLTIIVQIRKARTYRNVSKEPVKELNKKERKELYKKAQKKSAYKSFLKHKDKYNKQKRKKYNESNSQMKKRCKEYLKKAVSELPDWYVKAQIKNKHNNIKSKNIPKEFVEAVRFRILINRFLRSA